MVRDHPWIIAAAAFALAVIGWVGVAERPQSEPLARFRSMKSRAPFPDLGWV